MSALTALGQWARRHPLPVAVAFTAAMVGIYALLYRGSRPERHAFDPAFLIVYTLGLFLLWWLALWLRSRTERDSDLVRTDTRVGCLAEFALFLAGAFPAFLLWAWHR